MTRVLFICTGNIFRSMTAEFALCAAGIEGVRSAGLIKAPHPIVAFVADYLAAKGHSTDAHEPRVLTRDMLDAAALPVAMGIEHRDRIAAQFNRRLPLYSEIAYGAEHALLDVDQVVPDWRENETAARAYGTEVMDYIFDGIPGFVSRMNRFMQGADQSEEPRP